MRHTLMITLVVLGLLFSTGTVAGTVDAPPPAARLSSVEGLVDVRPENAARWTPAEDRQEVLPGDEIRCGARGPNGAALTLQGGGDVILGPGGLLRVEAGGKLHLIHGELAVMSAGPGTPKEGVWRAGKGGPKKLDKDPAWLDGFVNLNPREAMGALLANVDGREVSLTLGSHKVTVDVRDQIARTVIEESFVNHTGEILEGVFQFPLPQDASISNFGMWIGDRLVEADVVEKQRAREIYETIKREKRDPGLLEWAGGSLFKARVYPIPAHTEKRVTITYTQVLPLRRGAWTEDVTFVGADQGNSFIPRLWARRYLDELLRGGADVDRQGRIVAFSKEFRILTPYTSFRVLESDADRERFGVKRHFQMRDGEEFFAEGRARTDFALSRKAMKKAATWRTRLRKLVLSSMREWDGTSPCSRM